MPEWTISTNMSALADHVTADYFKVNCDGPFSFVEFKDADHKVVYMVSAQHVISVLRDDAPQSTVQGISVNVHYPRDEEATTRAISMAAKRLGGLE
jgi:hypothetical protein